MTVSPNPVPHSGQPVSAAGCAGVANTWTYDEVMRESGGAAVTLTTLVDVVDGTTQPTINVSITVQANGSFTRPRQLCFSTGSQHTLQATYRGTDANGHSMTATVPLVTRAAR